MASSSENGIEKDLQVLGLPADASPDEVKKAYRELVKRWHPDRFHSRSDKERRNADERIKEITGAYHRISREWANQKRERAEEARPEETAPPGETPRPDPGKASTAGTSSPKREARPRGRPPSFSQSARLRFAASFRGQPLKRKLAAAGAFAAIFLVFLGVTNLLGRLPLRFWEDSGAAVPEGSPQLGRKPPWDGPGGKTPSVEPPSPAEEEEEAPSPQPAGPAPPPLLSEGPDSPYFTLGSTPADVIRIQGSPTRVHGQVWTYGLSEVQFKDGRLVRYNNFDGSLRIRLLPHRALERSETGCFTIGSSEDDVLLVQGTPSRVDAGKWHYGFSEIQFKAGRVQGYQNFYGNLRVLMLPATPSPPAAARGYFTVGASADDVLALQGTPTSVQGNIWRYESSTVLFRQGKVLNAVNSDSNLHFLPPEDLKGKGKESG